MELLISTTYTGGDGGDGFLDDPAGRLAEIVTSGIPSRCYALAERLAELGMVGRDSAAMAALRAEIDQVFGVSSTENEDWSVVTRTACGITVTKTFVGSAVEDDDEELTIDHYSVEVSV